MDASTDERDGLGAKLLAAVKEGDAYKVSELLKMGADPDFQDRGDFGSTALIKVSFNGTDVNLQIASMLLKSGASTEVKNDRGETTLNCAARAGNVAMAVMLLEYGAQINTQSNEGYTPLISTHNFDLAKLLLRSGANVNITSEMSDNYTALWSAAYLKDLRMMALCLRYGADPNISLQSTAWTALNLPAQENDLERVKLLLQFGADPSVEDAYGRTVIGFLKGLNVNERMIRMIEQFNHGNKATDTELIKAVKSLDCGRVRAILMDGADPNEQSCLGYTALICASVLDSTKITKLLLEFGADPNIHGEGVVPALLWAAMMGNLESSTLLVKSGADKEAAMADGNTALHCASDYNHGDIARLLIENHADPDRQNGYGSSALMLTRSLGIARLLVHNGAQLELKNSSGSTALICAAYRGDVEIAKMLLEGLADPNAQDGKGWTALMKACGGGVFWQFDERHGEILRILLANGADYKVKNADGKSAYELAREQNGARAALDILPNPKEIDTEIERGGGALARLRRGAADPKRIKG